MTDRWYHQALHRLLRTGSVTFGDRPGVPIVAFDAMKRELREIARVAVQEERRQVRAILDDIDAGWHRAECEGRTTSRRPASGNGRSSGRSTPSTGGTAHGALRD